MDLESDSVKSATILRFPRKRGRPRTMRQLHDTGTPELIMKRLKGETTEALDLCLERGIITTDEHWCGVHLRWLYTLRHGAPSVRAIDPTHLGGIETRPDDPEWRTAREKEYHDAIKYLHTAGFALLLMNLCIYNERPRFLNRPGKMDKRNTKERSKDIAKIREALGQLAFHWGRKNTS